MKSVVNASEQKIKFPCILVSKYNTIVFGIQDEDGVHFSGVCLNADEDSDGNSIGDYSETWLYNMFTVFNGTVELSN